ncbi:MAG: hypothetical protein ACP5M5_03610 [Acidibrevibacterium sp.]|uniref:hypothetical protein n=1 Tax=Acidibrevibacterium sp. TaxID=2606776 RepID=UPI003D08D403
MRVFADHRSRWRAGAIAPALALATLLATGLVPHGAFAQVATPGLGGAGGGAGGAPGGAGPAGSNASDKEAPALAPALPGAVSTTDQVAPASKPAAEMSPNDALFDAIERGDLAGVRDALSRGAQLNAHDVLGETPLELAVDLGWHAIAFTLLSMRGAASGDNNAQNGVADISVLSRSESKMAALTRLPEAAPRGGHAAPAGAIATEIAFTGTPDPAAGFLGFAAPH